MIGIRNISKITKPTGIHIYEVVLTTVEGTGPDRKVYLRRICKFKHRREDGMARCIEIAAAAVKSTCYDDTFVAALLNISSPDKEL